MIYQLQMINDFINLIETIIDNDQCCERQYIYDVYQRVYLLVQKKYRIAIRKDLLQHQDYIRKGLLSPHKLFADMIVRRPTRSDSGELEITTATLSI